MEYMIETKNLTKKFEDLVAVDHINLEIKKGEIFGLLGPNGAGKTTTIHMLTTLLRPTEGTALVAGYDIRKNPEKVREKIGIVFQDVTVDRNLTGYENMWLHGKLYHIPKSELKGLIKELLEFVELDQWANVILRKYSGGMLRRLEIARGLLHHPEILFLDEPTLGLDPHSRAHIWEYILRVKKEKNMTILLTTHYMDEAERLCDRIAIIDHGKIIALGTPDELKSMVGGDVIYITIERSDHRMKVLAEKIVESGISKNIKPVSPGVLAITVNNVSEKIPLIFDVAQNNDIKIREVRYTRPTLDDVFLRLTGRKLRDEKGSWVDIARMRRQIRMARRR